MNENKINFCPKCGKPISDNTKFCSSCGLDLNSYKSQSHDSSNKEHTADNEIDD